MTMTMNPLAATAPASASTPAAPATPLHAGGVGRTGNADKSEAPIVVLPFAPLMARTGERDAAQSRAADGHGDSADESVDERVDERVDVLDAALMQALGELLGRGPAVTAGTDAIGIVAGGVRPGSEDADPDTTTSRDDASLPAAASAPLMAMLMPTLNPVATPPATVARNAPGTSGNTGDAANLAGAAAVPQAATIVPSALTTDAARLLALQGADAVVVPAGPADAGAWQGLQRWSADLMTTMTPGATTGAAGASTSSTLTLPASREAWQQPLMQALGDRLQLQIAQRADSARLHLEPPQLGRIEIDIRQQGGALQVQLSASNDEVRQQLRQIAEPLRHELVQRHAGDVSVQVASGAQAAGDGRGRDGAAAGGQPQSNGQQRDAQRQPGRALQDEDTGAAGASAAFGFADALAGSTASAGAGVMSGNTRTPR